MCTVLLPPGDNPIADNKYIVSCIIKQDKEEFLQKSVSDNLD